MPRMHRLATVAVIVCLPLIASPALAHHGNGFTRPDNADQQFEKIDMQPGGSYACEWGADELERSDISTSYGSADIHCRDAFHSGPWFGLATCTDVNWWNGLCDHYDIDFDLSDNDPNPDTIGEYNAWAYVGCHEFGHTGGLGHEVRSSAYSSCMEDGSGHLFFRQHDIDEINANV